MPFRLFKRPDRKESLKIKRLQTILSLSTFFLLASGPLFSEIEAASKFSEDELKVHYGSLLDNSPFLTKEWKNRNANLGDLNARKIRLQSYAHMNGEWRFGIYNDYSKTNHWLGVGESDGDLKVIQFDPVKELVTLDSPSGRLKLNLESVLTRRSRAYSRTPSSKIGEKNQNSQKQNKGRKKSQDRKKGKKDP